MSDITIDADFLQNLLDCLEDQKFIDDLELNNGGSERQREIDDVWRQGTDLLAKHHLEEAQKMSKENSEITNMINEENKSVFLNKDILDCSGIEP
jgi:hypothetical protein